MTEAGTRLINAAHQALAIARDPSPDVCVLEGLRSLAEAADLITDAGAVRVTVALSSVGISVTASKPAAIGRKLAFRTALWRELESLKFPRSALLAQMNAAVQEVA